jgi:hypothetical protein
MLLPVVTALGLARPRSRFVPWMAILLAVPTPYLLLARPDNSIAGWGEVVHHAVKPIATAGLFIWTLKEMSRSRMFGAVKIASKTAATSGPQHLSL